MKRMRFARKPLDDTATPTLPSRQLYLAATNQFHAEFQLAVFLRRHRHERHPAIQLIHHPGFDEPQRSSVHPGQLRIVTTGVCGPRLRISTGMLRHPHGVQFAQ